MRAGYRHHVTVTRRERDSVGNDRGEHTYHIIGTEDQVVEHVGRLVRTGLERGYGPVVISPIHPANVFDLGENR